MNGSVWIQHPHAAFHLIDIHLERQARIYGKHKTEGSGEAKY
jgi:hypothetical protein